MLMKLHSAPMYFYRRGKGRFQAAPEETLKLALAAVEKKKRLQERSRPGRSALARFECPPEIAALQGRAALLARPQQGRDKGARAGVQADRAHAGAAVRALRPVARQRTTTTCSASCTSSSRAARASRRTSCPALPEELPLADGARLQPRRHRHHRDRRRVFGARGMARRRAAHRHPHRRAGARHSRPARRWTPSRASGSRPPTCRGASSPCCPTTSIAALFARPRRRAPAVSLYFDVGARRSLRRARTAASSACRSPPTCATPSTTC